MKAKKNKTLTAWIALEDLDTGIYDKIAYANGYPEIAIQKTKPTIIKNGKKLPVVRGKITFEV